MSTLCDCRDPNCKADGIRVYKSIERLACYERTIARLRAELSAIDNVLLSSKNQFTGRIEQLMRLRGHE